MRPSPSSGSGQSHLMGLTSLGRAVPNSLYGVLLLDVLSGLEFLGGALSRPQVARPVLGREAEGRRKGSHGPRSHACSTALYISLVVLYRKYTRVRDNDFTAHGYAQAEAATAKL
jgi:hypothetical protein